METAATGPSSHSVGPEFYPEEVAAPEPPATAELWLLKQLETEGKCLTSAFLPVNGRPVPGESEPRPATACPAPPAPAQAAPEGQPACCGCGGEAPRPRAPHPQVAPLSASWRWHVGLGVGPGPGGATPRSGAPRGAAEPGQNQAKTRRGLLGLRTCSSSTRVSAESDNTQASSSFPEKMRLGKEAASFSWLGPGTCTWHFCVCYCSKEAAILRSVFIY
ncbi:translation initiation factor IF-2-like [Artibeus jamaicensis]|uniref:translation initiation factor IF-2-like n=1 Tax=Artibeus jamaicensis TaxID=9417 RepID=UPI00235A4788|nr:translation initiation factor IF-2-like [Artibeus jamaicensis]